MNAILLPDQIKVLQEHGNEFREWLMTDNGKQEASAHREHEKYFKQKLSRDSLKSISEKEFIEIWKRTWASMMWRNNKEYHIKNALISSGGIEKVRNELTALLYGSDHYANRYDEFRKNSKGFGVAFISELLNMLYPDQFCLWNTTPRMVLRFLGLTDHSSNVLGKQNLSGTQYQQCNDYLEIIRKHLAEFGVNDFIDLDVFFWHISEDVIPYKSKGTRHDKPVNNNGSRLEYLINSYDRDNNYFGSIKHTEEEVTESVQKLIATFPIEKIQQLKIDEYVIGKIDPVTGLKNENTFCYWLENRTPGFGNVRVSPNDKYGIYCNQNTQQYIYNTNKYDSAESAFQSIRSQILTILKAGKKFLSDENWNDLASTLEGDFEIRRHVRSKILSLYYPETFLRMHSDKNARIILQDLYNIPEEEIPDGLFLKQQKILELKNENPVTRKWNMNKYSRFIWNAKKDIQRNQDPDDQSKYLKSDVRVWVVRAGKKGEQEKDALNNNVITIRWNDLDDLATFQTRNEIIGVLSKLRPDIKTRSVESMSNSIWFFAKEIRQDDLVLVPLATTEKKSMAIGRVLGDYQYNPITSDVKHIRKVIWLTKNFPISSFNRNTRTHLGRPPTVYEIKDSLVKEDIGKVLASNGILTYTNDKQQFDELRESNARIISIDDLVNDTYLPKPWIEDIELLLKENRQIIFYGPPGTGKTFFAKKFARYFTKDNFVIIQFHPSYSYEDFVEGIKPYVSESGEVGGFTKQEGLFKKLVKECTVNKERDYLLIIDEINRGNVSRIFGELIYLLEYRDDEITLTYSPNEKFSIPKNLYIIGTMNSADRSIAFVDYALRRRFLFFEFSPNRQNSELLKKWFESNRSIEINSQSVITMLELINRIITDNLGREYQIGHSYFMKKNFDKKALETTINYAILPLVEQYFFGKKERIDEIRQICERTLLEVLSENQD